MINYLLGIAFVFLFGFTSEASAENFTRSNTKEYSSALAARARGGELVEGLVEYKIYSLNSPKNNFRSIKNCVLQHGYGITQPFLKQLRTAADFWGMDYLHEFAYVYFGESLISNLLREACETVMVPLQESNATSTLEMTVPTERFLRDRACNLTAESLVHASGRTQKGCALIGHSKAGAVAFNVARRCMAKTSEMGRPACEQLAKIYSATGTIQGAGATALVLGSKLRQEADGKLSWFELGQATALKVFDSIAALFAQTLLEGGSIVWDLRSDFVEGETNPTWLDLSPFTPMENGLPLYLANDMVLKKEGWLKADFSASATKHTFAGSLFEGLGCGKRPNFPDGLENIALLTKQNLLCESFGHSLGAIHANFLRSAYEAGVKGVAKWAEKGLDANLLGQNAKVIAAAMTWDGYQKGDGFAEFDLALGACTKGLGQINSAVKRCDTFANLNHQATAGGAVEARDRVVSALVD